MRIINLTNVSKNSWDQFINSSLDNFSLIPVSFERVIELNDPETWIWTNNNFYRIIPLWKISVSDIESIEISGPLLKGELKDYDKSDEIHSQILIRIRLSENFTKKYPKVKLDKYILTFLSEKNIPTRVKYLTDKDKRYFEYNENTRLEVISKEYPKQLFLVNFTIGAVPLVLLTDYNVSGIELHEEENWVPSDEETHVIFWGHLENYTGVYINETEDGFKIDYSFNKYNIIISKSTSHPNTYYIWTWLGLFILVIFNVIYISRTRPKLEPKSSRLILFFDKYLPAFSIFPISFIVYFAYDSRFSPHHISESSFIPYWIVIAIIIIRLIDKLFLKNKLTNGVLKWMKLKE